MRLVKLAELLVTGFGTLVALLRVKLVVVLITSMVGRFSWDEEEEATLL